VLQQLQLQQQLQQAATTTTTTGKLSRHMQQTTFIMLTFEVHLSRRLQRDLLLSLLLLIYIVDVAVAFPAIAAGSYDSIKKRTEKHQKATRNHNNL